MVPYLLALRSPRDLIAEFRKIGVDRGGIRIMAGKAATHLFKVPAVPSFWANILKQEMLSLGGDVALSRGSITGADKTTACLLLGTQAQLTALAGKLSRQPFGLSRIGGEIRLALGNAGRRKTTLSLGKKRFTLGRRTLLMGIMNVTPDSFSGDGLMGNDPKRLLSAAREMVRDGADILDVGGESTRPGARPVSAKEERRRVVPLLRQLASRVNAPVSIDTMKSEVAHAALDLGATLVNDISALRFDRKMAKLIARYKAGVVLMHMKGTPRTMQRHPQYAALTDEVVDFLADAIARAREAGIAEDKIIVDPGIGFGKTPAHNLEILARLSSLRSLGRPVLVGLSRKSFIGKLLGAEPSQRQWGTAGALAVAVAGGADIARVHDVKEMKQVATVVDSLAR